MKVRRKEGREKKEGGKYKKAYARICGSEIYSIVWLKKSISLFN